MISILIPAYNEEKRIGGTLDAITKFFNSSEEKYEVVVAVDGCTDNTKDIVTDHIIKNSSIKMTYNEGRSGKGGALLRAFRHSIGDKIVFADADNAAGPEELLKLAKGLDRYDVAWGQRTCENKNMKQPFWRTFVGTVYGCLVMLTFMSRFYDVQNGYKAFRRGVLENVFPKVKSLGIEYDLELLTKIRKAGYSISQPKVLWRHVEGSPSYNAVSHVFTYMRELVRIRLRTIF